MSTILKTTAVVLLAVFVVWLLNGMYAHYQITSSLAQEVGNLKTTNDALTKQVDQLKAISGAQAKFMVKQLVKDSRNSTKIKFRDAQKFLDSDEREKLDESFRCNGLSWHLYFKKINYGFGWKEDNLQVYVCHDITDFFGYTFRDWSVNATFDLTMINHEDKAKSKTEHFNQLFEKKSKYHCWAGMFDAISDLHNGFVEDDAIDFKVQFNSLQLKLID